MPIERWKHTCSATGGTSWGSNDRCKECGKLPIYDGFHLTMYEAMARYQYTYGMKPMGPHREMVHALLGQLHILCDICGGNSILNDCVYNGWSVCPKCEGSGGLWSVPPAEVEAARQKVLQAFPNADAPRPKHIFAAGLVALDLAKNVIVDLTDNSEQSMMPEPILPKIKMTPKNAQVIHRILALGSLKVREVYNFLMEEWAKAGYYVKTTELSIVLDIPYGNRTTPLAVILPRSSDEIADTFPGTRPRPAVIVLTWERLLRQRGFPPQAIDAYQKAVKKITPLHMTDSSAHIDMDGAFDLKSARELLRALKSIAKSVQPELVEELAPSKGVTRDNIQATLANCSPPVQVLFQQVMECWKMAGGVVQCRKPGRIFLRMKTKKHQAGLYAKSPRNFNLGVLASPKGKHGANVEISWDLAAREFGAYLDCIPEAVARFENIIGALPGFEQKGMITRLSIDETFKAEHADILVQAMTDLKKAEEAAE
jgi:hypothetical protein